MIYRGRRAVRTITPARILIGAALTVAIPIQAAESVERRAERFLEAVRSLDSETVVKLSATSEIPRIIEYEILRWEAPQRDAEAGTTVVGLEDQINEWAEMATYWNDQVAPQREAIKTADAVYREHQATFFEAYGKDPTTEEPPEMNAALAAVGDAKADLAFIERSAAEAQEKALELAVTQAEHMYVSQLSLGRDPRAGDEREIRTALTRLKIESVGGFVLTKTMKLTLSRWVGSDRAGEWVVTSLTEY